MHARVPISSVLRVLGASAARSLRRGTLPIRRMPIELPVASVVRPRPRAGNTPLSNFSKNALLAALLAASASAQGRIRPLQQRNLPTNLGTGRTIGMAGDGNELAVLVFDANTATTFGVVQISPGAPLCFGDSVITSDLSRGYVATVFGEIWVVDLTTTPPSLASGNNPFEITNFGLDLAITP